MKPPTFSVQRVDLFGGQPGLAIHKGVSVIRIRSMRVVAKRSFLLLNARFLQKGMLGPRLT